jgi:hypothetical protein
MTGEIIPPHLHFPSICIGQATLISIMRIAEPSLLDSTTLRYNVLPLKSLNGLLFVIITV